MYFLVLPKFVLLFLNLVCGPARIVVLNLFFFLALLSTNAFLRILSHSYELLVGKKVFF